MALKDRLKQRRMELDMTLEDVAQRIGTTRQTIQKYESGVVSNIPSDKIESLAQALGTTPAFLMGWDDGSALQNELQQASRIPIVGTVKAGYNGLAYEEDLGYDYADVKNPAQYLYFQVRGDSMSPQIPEGCLALVRKQPDVESGDLAVVVIDGEEGTLKKVTKQHGALVLQAFNPNVPPRIITGESLESLYIIGKVVETKNKW